MALTKTYRTPGQFALTKSDGFVDGPRTRTSRAPSALRLLIVSRSRRPPVHRQHLAARVGLPITRSACGFISIVVGDDHPAVIQKFSVQPNELTKEQPYIKRTSRRRATRSVFEYNDEQFNYDPKLNISRDDAAKVPTIDNTRLYDPLRHSTRSRPRRKVTRLFVQ